MKTIKTNLDTYDCNLLLSYINEDIENLKNSSSVYKKQLLSAYKKVYDKVLNIQMQVHNK